MARLTRSEQYMWAEIARQCIETFVAVGLPHFAEYSMEGDVEFVGMAHRLKGTLNYPELANKTKKTLSRLSRKMARNAENSIPEGKGELTAEDCQVAFLRFLFLADMLAMQAMYGCPIFTTHPAWLFCKDWLRGAVHLFESDPDDDQPLEEEEWADKEFWALCKAISH